MSAYMPNIVQRQRLHVRRGVNRLSSNDTLRMSGETQHKLDVSIIKRDVTLKQQYRDDAAVWVSLISVTNSQTISTFTHPRHLKMSPVIRRLRKACLTTLYFKCSCNVLFWSSYFANNLSILLREDNMCLRYFYFSNSLLSTRNSSLLRHFSFPNTRSIVLFKLLTLPLTYIKTTEYLPASKFNFAFYEIKATRHSLYLFKEFVSSFFTIMVIIHSLYYIQSTLWQKYYTYTDINTSPSFHFCNFYILY